MARHRQPLEKAKLKGAVHANPQRYPDFVPKSKKPLGECPPELSPEARKFWEHVLDVAPSEILTGADTQMLRTTCELVSYVNEKGVEDVPAAKIALMIGCLARMGFSPADR